MTLSIHCERLPHNQGFELTKKPSQFVFTPTVSGYSFQNSVSCVAGTYLIIFTALDNISTEGNSTIGSRMSSQAAIKFAALNLNSQLLSVGSEQITSDFGTSTPYSLTAGETLSFVFTISETVSAGSIFGQINKV